ncbi:MAG: hypothetical protein JWO13_2027 [Acidobacteriales bacterium]|nr:hypothetical protein [Terriglobales bacterium]
MNRIAMLKEVLEQNPTNAFARYGLAMEHAKAGDVETAMAEFTELLDAHPDYAPGYFMAAQTLAKAGRTDEAKTYLQNGIAAASRTGNAHAKGEMEAMLDELSY